MTHQEADDVELALDDLAERTEGQRGGDGVFNEEDRGDEKGRGLSLNREPDQESARCTRSKDRVMYDVQHQLPDDGVGLGPSRLRLDETVGDRDGNDQVDHHGCREPCVDVRLDHLCPC